MSFARTKFYKPALLGLCVVLLFGASRVQRELNRDRESYGITRMPPLENAPPVLAFTTVALGGFRGLIANVLWIRMNDLQQDDKFYEMVQLADWITKLEPHFAEVWSMQAWNMAYNVSVKFKEPQDRWRWVQRGFELIRDQGLAWNPTEPVLYWQLSYIFQHKMGQNLDDAHTYYKRAWYEEMTKVLGKKPNFDELINPRTDDARQRAKILREKYKLDPQLMKEVDERYGPLEWRLSDAHAIYWAELGRRKCKKTGLDRLSRSVYQTMLLQFRRGAVYENKIGGGFTLGPNLDNIQHVNEAYEELMKMDDPELKDQPSRGHKNFLLEAVYLLYSYNRKAEAEKWYKYLLEKYPTAVTDYLRQRKGGRIIEPPIALQDYVLERVLEEIGDTDVDKTRALVTAQFELSFYELAQDNDDMAAWYASFAEQIWHRYAERIKGAEVRIKLPTLPEIRERALNEILDSEKGLPPEFANHLRARLGLPMPQGSAKTGK